MTIKGWRERAGLPESYEVYGPSPVERAKVVEQTLDGERRAESCRN